MLFVFIDFFDRLKVAGAQRQLVIHDVTRRFLGLERLYRYHQTLNFRTISSKILVLQTDVWVIGDDVLDADCFIDFHQLYFALVSWLSKSLLRSRLHVGFRSDCSAGPRILNRRGHFPLLLSASALRESVPGSLVGTALHVGIGRDLGSLRMGHGVKIRKLAQVVLGIRYADTSKTGDSLIEDLLARVRRGIRPIGLAFGTLWEILHLVCI